MKSENIKLDKKDQIILYELEENCRRSLNQIAKKVGISKQALHYRIERLVKQGAIVQFITVIDYSKLGYVNHEVWFQLNEISPEEKEQFLLFLKNHQDVRWLVSCGGKFDYAMGIMAENIVAFSNILKRILAEYPNAVQNHFTTISHSVWTYPRTHMIGENTIKRSRLSLFGGEPKKMDLDGSEKRILQLISKNARMPTVEIAEKAGITPTTARTKIRKMEQQGVIEGYKAIIQHSAIGFENYEVLITTQNISEEKEKELEAYCRLNPYVTFLLSTIGRWDLDIAFDAENSEHFQQIMREIRTRFGSVIRDYEYVPILHIHKFDYAPQI